AADGLVHDAVAVPVDRISEDGARGQSAGGPKGEGERLVAETGLRPGDGGDRVHVDARLGGGEGRVGRVPYRDRVLAGRVQDGPEVARAVVVRPEGVVVGQKSQAVRTGDVDGPGVVGGQVAVGVVGGDGEVAVVPHGDRRREAADLEGAGGGRVDHDAPLG